MADKVHVKGLEAFQRGLRQIDNGLGAELRKGLNEVAELVAVEARRHVPIKSGAAAASYKAGSSQRAAAVKIGGNKAPYVPWLEWGGRVGRNKSVQRPRVKAGRYLYPALDRNADTVLEKLDEVVARLVAQAGFETREV